MTKSLFHRMFTRKPTTCITKNQDKALIKARKNVLMMPVEFNPKKAMSTPNMNNRRTAMRTERGRMVFSRLMDGKMVDVLFLGNRAV